MAQHKIPAFLSKDFNSKSTSEKQELLRQLKAWKESPMTEKLLVWIIDSVDKSYKEEDGKTTFSSLFESKYSTAYSKAERNSLRTVIKQLERDE